MANNYVLNAAADVFEQILILELEKKTKKREYWVRKWISRRNTLGASGTLLKELHFEDPRSYCNFLRVDYDMFYELLQKVGPIIQRQNTTMRTAIPAAIKLQVVLRYLASGDSISSLQYLYRVPKNTISCFLEEVLDAISSQLKEFIQVMSTEL
ncbi:unnamed protein product [Macrosiphum euphorbiae]|uniref:Nuclease HARBI1 n=1 Tax=Macrosiphum euphorbiae TaxID=13131 RepID=A0AAV0Y6Z5_9HEMI|nr:unnamed protein product [Macrosiphum euphorbiae]